MRSLAEVVRRWSIVLVSAWALSVCASNGDDPGVGGLARARDLSMNATAASDKAVKVLNASSLVEKKSSGVARTLQLPAEASSEASNDDDGDDRSHAGLTSPSNTEAVAAKPAAVTDPLARKEESAAKLVALTLGNSAEKIANVSTPAAPLSFLQAIFQAARISKSEEAATNSQSDSAQQATKDNKGVFVLAATAVKSSTTRSGGAAGTAVHGESQISKSYEKQDLGVDGLKEATTSASSLGQPTTTLNGGVNGTATVATRSKDAAKNSYVEKESAPVRRDSRPITHPLWRNARGKGSNEEGKEESNSNPLRVRFSMFEAFLIVCFSVPYIYIFLLLCVHVYAGHPK